MGPMQSPAQPRFLNTWYKISRGSMQHAVFLSQAPTQNSLSPLLLCTVTSAGNFVSGVMDICIFQLSTCN